MSKDEEIPVEIVDEKENNETSNEVSHEIAIEENESDNELQELLEKEKIKSADYEDKLKHTLADFQNLQRKIQTDIEDGINTKLDQFMIDFLQIYDDFLRAKDVFAENNIDTAGLDSILKNIESLMKKYKVSPIDSLGEIFDPKFHEAISIVEDPSLDEDTITKELRKGYISHNRVIRPALVEISKKSK